MSENTSASGRPSIRPYAAAVKIIAQKGLGAALPIRAGHKGPPPSGFTGGHGAVPSAKQTAEWLAKQGHNNVCIRLARGLVGIDVDEHRVSGVLAEAERRWGPLPAVPFSSSRNDGSGIRLYRLEAPIPDFKDPIYGIEVIHFGSRYVMAPPSVHPSGQPYRWIGGAMPSAEDLPMLPPSWVQAVTKPRDRGRSAGLKVPTMPSPTKEWSRYQRRVRDEHRQMQFLSEGERDQQGRGWEKWTADLAFRLHGALLSGRAPFTEAEAKAFYDSVTLDPYLHAEKWRTQRGQAVKQRAKRG